jgi:hypothetical protein
MILWHVDYTWPLFRWMMSATLDVRRSSQLTFRLPEHFTYLAHLISLEWQRLLPVELRFFTFEDWSKGE